MTIAEAPFVITKYAEFAASRGLTWPTPCGIRWHVRHADRNGLNAALIRKGKRILIDPEKFLAWLSQNNEIGATSGPELLTHKKDGRRP